MRGRRSTAAVLAAPIFCVVCAASLAARDVREFQRGDANYSRGIDLSDGIYILQYLFRGGTAPLCSGLSNANASRGTDLGDAIFVFAYLFRGGAELQPLSAEETAECEANRALRCGEEVFRSPDPLGNSFSCGLCHGTNPAPLPLTDVLRPGHGLGDAVWRPSFFNAQVFDLLEAINTCRRDWMEAPPWTSDEQAYRDLRTFLEALPLTNDPAPAVTFRIVPPATSGPSAGDPVNGCDLFGRACASCHGPQGAGDIGPSLWKEPLTADSIREVIRLSGPTPATVPGTLYEGLLGNAMPFWSADRLSDDDVEDIVAYLAVAADPSRRPCNQVVDPELIRAGDFRTRLHGVRGRVEHWSDRKIRLVNFFYDGQGPPEVLVWLYLKTQAPEDILGGKRISEHLARSTPYVGETLEYTIPDEIGDDMFDTVAIWCTEFLLNYGEADLRP